MGLRFLALALFLQFVFLSVSSCGDSKNTCEKALEVQEKLCLQHKAEHTETCLGPCFCVLRGMKYRIVFNEFMQIDLNESGCEPTGSCEGSDLEFAESCLEDESTCDPCVHLDTGIIMCGSPAFPECCSDIWQ